MTRRSGWITRDMSCTRRATRGCPDPAGARSERDAHRTAGKEPSDLQNTNMLKLFIKHCLISLRDVALKAQLASVRFSCLHVCCDNTDRDV